MLYRVATRYRAGAARVLRALRRDLVAQEEPQCHHAGGGRRPLRGALQQAGLVWFGLAHCWVCRKAVPTQCAVLCSRLIPVQMWHVMSCVWPAHITARQWSAFQPALVEGRVCAIWHIAVGLTQYRWHHHARIRGRHCLGRYYFVERLDEAIPLHTPLCSSCSEICEYERHTHTRARTHRNTHTRICTNRNMPALTHAHRYECYKSSKMKDVQFTMCRRCYQQQLFPDDLMSGSLEFVRRLAPPCCGWQHNTE